MEFPKEQELYTQIVQKSWDDTQFKADLMANPVSTIEKLTGQKLNLPEGKTLVVRDQTDSSVYYINIPAKPETEDVELNEEELEAVAGGVYIVSTTIKLPDWPILTTTTTIPTTI